VAFHGSSSGLGVHSSWSIYGDQTDEDFGESVAGAGDVNGDGFCDVLVGAPRYDGTHADEGRALLYMGRHSGLERQPNWETRGGESSANWGRSVAGAGDVNADGYSDVIVGAPGGGSNLGKVCVYHGARRGPGDSADWFIFSVQSASAFGYSVDSAGDVNNDGYADIIVGAPFYDNGQADEGRAYVYYGSSSGVRGSGYWSKESDNAGSLFGFSVSGAGDVDSDGCADVIVGSPYYPSGGQQFSL